MTLSTNFRMAYPPSVNEYWKPTIIYPNGKQRPVPSIRITARGKEYRREAIGLTDEKFGDKRVSVAIDAYMPSTRSCDLDNINKAILDAIEHAGIIDNDSQVDMLVVRRGGVDPEGNGCVDVTISEYKFGNVIVVKSWAKILDLLEQIVGALPSTKTIVQEIKHNLINE